MQCLNTRSILCAISLVLFLSLAGCEEDVAGPTGVDEPFSLYGVFNPRLPMQTVLVGPVEDLLFPETRGALDAVVTSTDLGSGKVYVWQDSVVANATGQLDHIYWADFTPGYGSRHRMEVVRSDGAKSVVNIEIPGEVRINYYDSNTRDIMVTAKGMSDFLLVRIDVIYSVRFYDKFKSNTPCSTPLKNYTFSYNNNEIEIENGWELDINLSLPYETMRSYYHDDTGIKFWNPDTDGLALFGIWLDITVGSADWGPPGSDPADQRVFVHPGTLSNVDNGYGLVAGGYNEETVLYPSFRAVADTPFFDYIQRDGGDYCLGTL